MSCIWRRHAACNLLAFLRAKGVAWLQLGHQPTFSNPWCACVQIYSVIYPMQVTGNSCR